ncbi:hypothetical protein [Clostridium sp.]|uniref:hypothetical protein n=1 Tax=Clostridium sp. TaxID=1506 RepID=UPI002FC84EE0
MLKVFFDFDIDSQAVSNIKVISISSKYDNIDIPIIEVGDNKLIISPKAVELMSICYNDRITVNYLQKNNELTIPIIGKAEIFADQNAGNKVLRNNTVSFKGAQKTILTKYGNLFRIEEYKPGMFKMSSINKIDLIPTTSNLE